MAITREGEETREVRTQLLKRDALGVAERLHHMACVNDIDRFTIQHFPRYTFHGTPMFIAHWAMAIGNPELASKRRGTTPDGRPHLTQVVRLQEVAPPQRNSGR